MPPEPLRRIIRAGKRHLRTTDMLRRLVTVIGVVAAIGAILLGIARYVVIPWAETVAFGAIGVAVLGAAVITLFRPPTDARAALEVDQRLGGKDRVSTALELSLMSPRSGTLSDSIKWVVRNPS